MMWIIVLVLVMLLIAVSGMYMHSVWRLRRDIEDILQFKTHAVIKQNSQFPGYKELVHRLNQLILSYHELEARYKRIDRHQKQTISSISHDFRTPLTSMLGYIQLVQGNIQDEKDENRLKIVERRIRYMNEHVEDFYAISLLESMEYPLNPVTLDPIHILQDCLALMYDELNQHFSDLNIDLKEGWRAVADRKALERIFTNIIKNALTHGHGFLAIESHSAANGLLLKFRNGGFDKNMDPERLFERNYRSSSNTQSSGLGLAIAAELGALMDVKLRAEGEGESLNIIVLIKNARSVS